MTMVKTKNVNIIRCNNSNINNIIPMINHDYTNLDRVSKVMLLLILNLSIL